jgi:hypothetical protein
VLFGDEDTRAWHVDEGQFILEQPLHRCRHGLGIIGRCVEVNPDLGDAVVGFTGTRLSRTPSVSGPKTVWFWAYRVIVGIAARTDRTRSAWLLSQ